MTQVTAYQCVHCKQLFTNKKKQQKCTRNCLQAKKEHEAQLELKARKLELSDTVRLTCDNIHKLPRMICEFVQEHFDREMTMEWHPNFSELGITHDAPIGVKTDWNGGTKYLGWSGQAKGTCSFYKNPIVNHPLGKWNEGKIDSIFDLFDRFGGVLRGVHQGTGSGGDSYSFSMRVYLDDFPILKEKYEKFAVLDAASRAWHDEQKRRHDEAEQLVENTAEVVDAKASIAVLDAVKQNAIAYLNELRDGVRATEEYDAIRTVPKQFDYDIEEFHELREQFPGRGRR